MKLEAQRIAIAEACGWKQTFLPNLGDVYNINPNVVTRMPDYLNDLNAMHEMEKQLDPLGKDGSYEYWLRTVCHIPERESAKGRYFYRATASQRAEAFLRTLNLWTTD